MEVVEILPLKDNTSYNPVLRLLLKLSAKDLGKNNFTISAYKSTIKTFIEVLGKKIYIGEFESAGRRNIIFQGSYHSEMFEYILIMNRDVFFNVNALINLDSDIIDSRKIPIILGSFSMIFSYTIDGKSHTDIFHKVVNEKKEFDLDLWKSLYAFVDDYYVTIISPSTYEKLGKIAREAGLPTHMTLDDIVNFLIDEYYKGKSNVPE